jgi:hypothetical protein
MSIITKPSGGVLKGVPATFTLSKVELLSVPMVAADSYFSDSDNWNKVILKYKSSEGKQYEVVEFNATSSSPTGIFSVSEKARDAFEIQTLEIIDFDGGIFIVPRGSLTAAEFDINFAPVGPTSVTWNVAGKTGVGTVTTGANGLITKASGGSGYNVNVLSSETITGDGYVEFIWSHTNVVFGIAETIHPSGSYTNTVYGGYNAGGGWEVYAPSAFNGSGLANNSLTVGDVVKIERVGNLFKAFKNGLLMHTCNINNLNPLKASICIYTETNGVNGATISE